MAAPQAPQNDAISPEESSFLPSFCDVRIVFVVVVAAELLAIILTLAPLEASAGRWSDLGLASMLIQWVALSSAAVLCIARPLLQGFSNRTVGLVSYGLLLVVTALISEAAYWVVHFAPAIAPLDAAGHAGFILRNVAVSAVISAAALRYLYVQHQWKQQVQAEARARIQALQARIRPHFLFNSLNTIAELVSSQPDQAEEAVQDLADLFRVTLGSRDRVQLAEELEITRRYAHIESLRLGDRLRMVWEVDDLPGHVMVPQLILQPLVENAIFHGIEQQPLGGTVTVACRITGELVNLEVSNPRPPPGAPGQHSGNRMALDNIRQRLALAFGVQGGLEVRHEGDQYLVRIQFPTGGQW